LLKKGWLQDLDIEKIGWVALGESWSLVTRQRLVGRKPCIGAQETPSQNAGGLRLGNQLLDVFKIH
jgi:hypothetical protein